MQVELIPCTKKNTLHIDGFLYRYQYKRSHNRTYWLCRKSQSINCTARAVIENESETIIHRGPYDSTHNHLPNYEEVHKLKKKVEDLKNKFTEEISYCQPLDLSTKLKRQADLTSDRGHSNGRSLKRSGVIYRSFLIKFLERPFFTKRVIYAVLKRIYKSYATIRSTYYDIIKFRSQIEADLLQLRDNPDAVILPLVRNFKQDRCNQGSYSDSYNFVECEFTAQDGSEGDEYNVSNSRPELRMNWLEQLISQKTLGIDVATECSEKKKDLESDYLRNYNVPANPSSDHSGSSEFMNNDELQSVHNYSTSSHYQTMPTGFDINQSLAYGYSMSNHKNIPTVTDQRVLMAQPSINVWGSHYSPIFVDCCMSNNISVNQKY